MNSEKNQFQAIASFAALLVACVVIFFLVGGNFLSFSTDGVLGKLPWLVPVAMILVQQLYIIPQYLKSYWKLFSVESPNNLDLYLPIINENKIFPSTLTCRVIMVAWDVIGVLIGFNLLPYIGIDFIIVAIGSVMGTGFVASVSFYSLFLVIVGIILISIIRGTQYVSIRRDIYDLHNKYLGIRGAGFVSFFYRVLYFVPLARSFSLLADMQIMDKLTKFNAVEDMKIELREG